MAEIKKLFNEMDRNYTGPPLYAEPMFNYLNRCASSECEEIRNLLERWFRNFPSESQNELRTRFRSKDDSLHLGAFFELYLYELLSKCGFSVEIHPTVPNTTRHPDFKVLKNGKPLFYVETTLAGLSDEETSAKATENQLYDELEERMKLSKKLSNFSIVVNKIRGRLPTPPPVSKIWNFLKNKLSNLNPDKILKQYEQGGLKALPHWTWKDKSCNITFFLMPIPPKVRGELNLKVRTYGVKLNTPHIGIKNSIKKKATKYGKLDLPYIVAINVVNAIKVDDFNIMDALFGEEQYVISSWGNNVTLQEVIRKPNSVWWGPNGPQNTRVSAVLIAIKLSPWNIARVTPVLWHNPWANYPLSPDTWQLPQLVLDKRDNWLLKKDGKRAWELFRLNSNWPSTKENKKHIN
jgi:hypothetical protein